MLGIHTFAAAAAVARSGRSSAVHRAIALVKSRSVVTKAPFASSWGVDTYIVDTDTHEIYHPEIPNTPMGTHAGLNDEVLNDALQAGEPLSLVPNGFRVNSAFERAIYDTLRDHIHEDNEIKARARHQYIGHYNVNDERAEVAYGRVADPEDIFGIVRLDEGSVVPGTFEPLMTHRLFTTQGFFKLPQELEVKLIDRLNKV